MNGPSLHDPIPALRRTAYRCAAHALLRPTDTYRLIQGLRLFLCPVDLWRNIEFPAVLAEAPIGARILDLGSPRLLAAHLVRHEKTRVTCADISPAIVGEMRVYRSWGRGALHGVRADGMALPLAGETYDFAYAVSSIEHIAGDGDSVAIAEMARVLRPGARCVVTIPVTRDGGEVWQDADPFGGQQRTSEGKVFFCRTYSEDMAHRRLIEPSGMICESLSLWQWTTESWAARYHRITNRPRSAASILIKGRDRHWARTRIERASGWGALRNVGVVCAVLRKPRHDEGTGNPMA